MRGLRWLGPRLHHPRLWHIRRRGLALGLALGVFFGLLIPVAQIPLSATAAVLLRANLPAAVASTLVTNPVTFGPVYYGAYRLGSWILQSNGAHEDVVVLPPAESAQEAQGSATARTWGWLVRLWDWVTTVGKPLVLGLSVLASLAGTFVYFSVQWLWALRVRRKRQRRLRARQACSGAGA